MSTPEIYDKILRELPDDATLVDAEQYTQTHLRYLANSSYIDIVDTEDKGIMLIGITQHGMIFISEGGFTEQARLKAVAEHDLKLQRENWITTTESAKRANLIAWISLVVSIIAGITAVVALM